MIRYRRFATIASLACLLSLPAFAQTKTWSATPPSNVWAEPFNWVGTVVPVNGENLLFPASSVKSLNNDLFTLSSVTGISIAAPGYQLSGFGLGVSGLVEYNVSSAVSSSILLPLTQNGPLTIRGDDVATLTIDKLTTDGASNVTIENKVAFDSQLFGPGDLVVSGAGSSLVTISGPGTAFSGSINVNPGGSLVMAGDYLLGGSKLLASPGASLYFADGSKFGLVGPIPGSSGIAPDVHIGEGTPTGKIAGKFTTTDINFTGGSLSIDINGTTPGSGYDQLFAQNLISLSNVVLDLRKSAGFVPPGGSQFRILDIDPGSFMGLSGTFQGLPGGSTITVGGVNFRIDYDFLGVTLTVPSLVRTWKGSSGGTTQNWSNVSNWAEEAAPVAGSDLGFPSSALSRVAINDMSAGLLINSISITGSGYDLSGNAISLAKGIELSGASSGPAIVSMPIDFTGPQGITTTSPLTLTGSLFINGNVVLTGPITITGGLTGPRSLLVQGSGTTADITTTSAMTGTIQAQSKALLRFKGSHKGPLSVQSDSTAEITGSAAQILASGLLVVGGEGSIGSASAPTITFGSSARARFDISSNGSDSLQGATITLGGATLELVAGAPLSSADEAAPLATQYTIVNNTSSSAISGTFRGLAEGAIITVGGKTMTISYKGGTGNDVVLTASGGTACTVSIVASKSVKPSSTGNTASIAVPAAGTTYTWTLSNATITAGQGTPSIVYTAGAAGSVQLSVTASGGCNGTSSLTATIDLDPASVILSATPSTIALVSGSASGGSTSYTLTNIGDGSTTVRLTQSGAFFTQQPTSFTLAGGGSQTITISVAPQATTSTQTGSSKPQGQGVPVGLSVPVTLLVTAPPSSGTPEVIATIDRIDVSASRGENPRGSASYKNIGTAIANGTPSSNVPWIIPDPTGIISIPPGGTVSMGFSIDRTQRPDSSFPTGSVAGALSFVYATASSGARGTSEGGSLAASIPISDTVKPPTANGIIPPLAVGEVALVVPGVGNVVGSGGKLFVSDITLLNKSPLAALPDAKLYYIPPSGSAAEAKLDPLGAGGAINLANVVSTVFNQTQQVGTLMVRSSRIGDMVVSATIFNDNNPKGRYGTVVPVLRSDAAVKVGQKLVINGISRNATSHTNLYVQEMAGTATSATVKFLGANGAQVGQPLPVVIQPFALASLNSVVPEGAVAIVVTNDSGGALMSYATPVDDAPGGGDTWAQTDWNKQYSLSGGEPLLVPVAGAAPGANQSYFRTDVSITNTGNATATAALRYTSGATIVTKYVELAPLATAVLNDVVAGFLGVTPPSIGSLAITPQAGTFVVTSRTYTSTQGSAATFGTAAPTVALSSGLVAGQSRLIAGIEDSKQTTVTAGTPKTARTNFGIVETKGQAATVKVSLFLNDGRDIAFGAAKGSATFQLGPNEFRLIPSLTKTILGDARETQFGDLKSVMVRFDIIGGAGAVVPFVTSTDNGTNDTIFRNE
ncbi:MAG: hypothetical protein WC538_18195 [Thermoanaerobaculia bacterium]|jgi:hypothetical protein